MRISYRKLIPGDEANYRLLRLECLNNFPDKFGSSYEEEAKSPKLKFEHFIENQSANNFMYGAFADTENLIGIVGFSQGDRTKTRHRGEIVQMYVDPEFHGQRIGENLILELIKAAFKLNEIESLELKAVVNNLAAVNLYKKIGFKVFGLQKNYFKAGDRYWNQVYMQLLREEFYQDSF